MLPRDAQTRKEFIIGCFILVVADKIVFAYLIPLRRIAIFTITGRVSRHS